MDLTKYWTQIACLDCLPVKNVWGGCSPAGGLVKSDFCEATFKF